VPAVDVVSARDKAPGGDVEKEEKGTLADKEIDLLIF
jgi:hypothetical protein